MTTTTPDLEAGWLDTLAVLRDYAAELEAALAAGDERRAQRAAATIENEAGLARLALGGGVVGLTLRAVTRRMTDEGRRYTPDLRPPAARA